MNERLEVGVYHLKEPDEHFGKRDLGGILLKEGQMMTHFLHKKLENRICHLEEVIESPHRKIERARWPVTSSSTPEVR